MQKVRGVTEKRSRRLPDKLHHPWRAKTGRAAGQKTPLGEKGLYFAISLEKNKNSRERVMPAWGIHRKPLEGGKRNSETTRAVRRYTFCR